MPGVNSSPMYNWQWKRRTNSVIISINLLEWSDNMGLVLIGFMGTGKSTIALQLSQIMGLPVVEMDRQIVQREQLEISEIFATYGESYFRDLETALLRELQMNNRVIISCGGGTPLRECNVIEMKKNGPVFLLTASPKTIWERVKENKERPLLNGNMSIEYIEKLMMDRKDKYLAAADYVIETDGKQPEQICRDIMKIIKEEKINV